MNLYVLLALYRKADFAERTCWEVKGCSKGARRDCLACVVGKGEFCWLFADKECGQKTGTDDQPVACLSCPVILRLHEDLSVN